MRSAATRAAAAATALAMGLSTAAGAAQPAAGDTIELASANGRTSCQIVGDDYGWAGGAICIHRAASGWPDGWFAISWPFWCTPTAWLSNTTGPAKIVLPDGCVFPGATNTVEDGEQATSRDGWVSVLYGRGVVRSLFPMPYMEVL